MPLSPSSLNAYEFNSKAEENIYHAAFVSGYFNNTDRYFFHSLKMVKTGNKKQKAEIDFVYLDKDCILFFEVKGGEVKFDSAHNDWYVLGGTERGDPFEQAYKGLFNTRDKLLPDLFKNQSVTSRLAFGIGVLFPESCRPDEFRKATVGQMELDPDLIFDYNDFKNNRLILFIENTKKYWSKHLQYINRPGISSREMSAISKFFRQDLHFRLPVSDLLKKSNSELDRLTGMQMFILDNLQYNPGRGGIILGGPGTGKTILALELLRKKISENKRVLLVCYNITLAEFLKKKCSNIFNSNYFDVYHIHSLYNKYIWGTKSFNQLSELIDNNVLWNQTLPLEFSRNFDTSLKEKYDYIIIDEGQDILNEYHVDALSNILKGGFESGNWAVFMDKDFQNIYNDSVEEYFEYFREVYPSFVMLLYLNCRNTLSSIKRASEQTGLPIMQCLRVDQNWKSEIRQYETELDLRNKINDAVSNLEKSGVARKYITILCFTKEQINSFIAANPKKYVEGAFEVEGFINISTIHSYKGLENQFIIICGPREYIPEDKKQMSLIYIANTRATSQSIFFINSRFVHVIVDRINSSL
jgi:hypothetical protein